MLLRSKTEKNNWTRESNQPKTDNDNFSLISSVVLITENSSSIAKMMNENNEGIMRQNNNNKMEGKRLLPPYKRFYKKEPQKNEEIEDLSDEIFIKRHRNLERKERKILNREKEVYLYNIQQNQREEERLKHLEINGLIKS